MTDAVVTETTQAGRPARRPDGRRAFALGTRGSALALRQAQVVADALAVASGRSVRLQVITTAGDRSGRPVSELGDTGVFVTGVRDALLAGEVDLAVHSYKDLPTAAVDGLVIGAVPPRADPRDVVVTTGGQLLSALPPGARVGTGAARRAALLRASGLAIEVVPMRGNVTTRIEAVRAGTIDAVVLAFAGLTRLGLADAAAEILDPADFVPAPAQGALAVECRADDEQMIAALAGLDDGAARATVTAERATLAGLQAGCTAPVGAFATVGGAAAVGTVGGAAISVRGVVAAIDGSAVIRSSQHGFTNQADDVGRRLAADLIAAGAATLLGSTR